MRATIFGHLPPASSSCVTTFLLTTILLSIVSNATPSGRAGLLDLRDERHHEGHYHDGHASGHEAMVMSESTAGVENDDVASTSAVIASPKPTSIHSDPHGGHSHGSHAPAKTVLDDADIHFWHKYPPSYLAADFRLDNDSAIFGEEFDEAWDPNDASGHRGLAILHVLSFYTAYFGFLPITLALRAAEHPSHYFVNVVFLILATLGWLSGAAYKAGTIDRYEGSVYPIFVNILLLSSYVLAAVDSLDLIKRVVSFCRFGRHSWRDFASHVLRSDDDQSSGLQNRYEMVGLVDSNEHRAFHDDDNHVVFAPGDEEEDLDLPPPRTLAGNHDPRRPSLFRQWSPPSRNSTGSEGTLHDSPTVGPPSDDTFRKHQDRSGLYDLGTDNEASPAWKEEAKKAVCLMRFLQIVLTWIRRFQVVFAYVTLIIGLTNYTGMCRGSFVNSCAAHYIKGSIFFGYGLLTFARYLGAYADLGWAWNRHTGHRRGPSAEMVECSVIFVYGVTNTWLERLGAAPGSPYNVKQVQHISIAVMFWFAGLSGILLESKTMRRVLAAVRGRRGETTEPLSYAFSFNPLPALVIAVTGLAMAAHHQTYVFQVEIHSLWGILLAGGSAFRFLTYFFLWLRPPTDSFLPSRPPTEVLTSFGYAAGGIVFMLSNEEIAFAAMRAGYDDMMAFLNFTVALTSLIFCWTVVVMAVKGWGVLRMQGSELDEERT